MYLGDIYTVMINIAGVPSMAIPCGFDSEGLPVGMQLIGKPSAKRKSSRRRKAYQSVTDFHKQSPKAE